MVRTVVTDSGPIAINEQKIVRYSPPSEWARQGFTSVDLTLLWDIHGRKMTPAKVAQELRIYPEDERMLTFYFTSRQPKAEKIIRGSGVQEDQVTGLNKMLLEQMRADGVIK